MASFDAMAAAATDLQVRHLGEAVTFTGTAGAVSTYAIIDKAVEWAGADLVIAGDRYLCSLLVADVGAPKRGDTVTTAAAAVWVLQENLPGTDSWLSTWTVDAQ